MPIIAIFLHRLVLLSMFIVNTRIYRYGMQLAVVIVYVIGLINPVSPDVKLVSKVLQADACPLFCLWTPVLRLTLLAYTFRVTVPVLIIVMNYLDV